MSLLIQQSAEEWTPMVMEYVAVLDRRPEELTAKYGWRWTEGEEPGLGRMKYVGLAHQGRSRYVLIASVDNPARGIALEASVDEEPARARADFLAALGLEPDTFLSIREGAVWFERWDESKPFRAAGGGAASGA